MPTILVTDDNPPSLNYTIFLLKKLKFEAVPARSWGDALGKAEANSFDGALIDINLGAGMSGIQLMRALRKKEEFRKTPIIAITAFYKDYEPEELVSEGFTDFLAKPFRMADLRKILEKYLPPSPPNSVS